MNLKRIEEGVDPAKHSEKVKQTIRDAYVGMIMNILVLESAETLS